MPDPEQAVTEENSAPSTPETVNDQTVETTPTETTSTQETSQEQTTPEQTQHVPDPSSDVDERGVPWRNRAMEAERKLHELPTVVRQTVQEAMQASTQPKEREYTIEELESFVADNPKYRPWAEAEKAKILQRNLERSIDSKLQATRVEGEQNAVRVQTEQWVLNHPEFKSCFRTDPMGNKVWDYTNPMTQTMGAILNTVDPFTGKMVKDRPDGLRVAAEMAYGRMALANKGKVTTTMTQLKRDLRKTQVKTMVNAGGTQTTTPVSSNTKKHIDNYNKTYNKSDIQNATKEYLKAQGFLKEE